MLMNLLKRILEEVSVLVSFQRYGDIAYARDTSFFTSKKKSQERFDPILMKFGIYFYISEYLIIMLQSIDIYKNQKSKWKVAKYLNKFSLKLKIFLQCIGIQVYMDNFQINRLSRQDNYNSYKNLIPKKKNDNRILNTQKINNFDCSHRIFQRTLNVRECN